VTRSFRKSGFGEIVSGDKGKFPARACRGAKDPWKSGGGEQATCKAGREDLASGVLQGRYTDFWQKGGKGPKACWPITVVGRVKSGERGKKGKGKGRIAPLVRGRFEIEEWKGGEGT